MNASLASVHAKIQRAQETASLLLGEIAAFLAENNTPFRVTASLRNGKDYVFTAHGTLDVPVRFSVMVGEVVYQLRTVLDHLLAALVVANDNVPTDKHQFPIASTPEKFAEAVKRGDIKGVSPKISHLIEQFQPYQPPNKPPAVLNLLREFSNTDKHRALVLVGGGAAMANEIHLEETDGPTSIIGMSPPKVRRITEQGVEFFEINFGEYHQHVRATLGCVPHVVVANLDPLECATVEEVVTAMISVVNHLVGQFESAVA